MARILRGEIRWADLNPVGAALAEEIAQVIDGLNEIIG
jgi:hypothetical protein